MAKTINKPDASVSQILVDSASNDAGIRDAAQAEMARAIQEPLRQGMLNGDVISPIFTPMILPLGSPPEYELDLLTPGNEDDHIAYTNPGNGRIAERHVEADFVMVPTYGIASAVDWTLRAFKASRLDRVGRAMQILEAGFVRKINNDGWHTVLSAATDRNILVYDADASAGQFTKRLLSLAQTVMQRNAGGNGASLNPGVLTDVYMSLEALQDVRNWGVDQVDDFTRREIFTSNGIMTSIYGINLHSMYEFGVDQEYQLFYTNQLSGTMGAGDLEIAVGCDLSTDDSFVMPVTQEVSIFPDPALHRLQRAGFYGWADLGFGVLDNRRLILLSL